MFAWDKKKEAEKLSFGEKVSQPPLMTIVNF